LTLDASAHGMPALVFRRRAFYTSAHFEQVLLKMRRWEDCHEVSSRLLGCGDVFRFVRRRFRAIATADNHPSDDPLL
jgi:hypothetical protein